MGERHLSDLCRQQEYPGEWRRSIATANAEAVYINPLPSADVDRDCGQCRCDRAFALALIVRLYRVYGTTDLRRIVVRRKEVTGDDGFAQG